MTFIQFLSFKFATPVRFRSGLGNLETILTVNTFTAPGGVYTTAQEP
jgi:hypothetical protein